MKQVALVYFDAGGGHRAAANALRAAAEEQGRAWNVRLLHLQEVLGPLDIIRRLTGTKMEDFYNAALRKGWTLRLEYLLPAFRLMIRMQAAAALPLLEGEWRRDPPDLVVSLIPHFNRLLCESLRNVCPGVPFVTVLTDLADFPPHFWIERQEQHFICGTEEAVAQAHEMGHPPERISRVSGMILHPRFYQSAAVDRRAERRRLGLDPDVPTVLLLFGGFGSRAMLDVAQRLEQRDVQLICICGRNRELAERLRNSKLRLPMFVEGFTHEVPYYMRLADFLIGKPGPASISEALLMGLPVIVESNSWTLPQERFNARWIDTHEVGRVVSSFRHVATAVNETLKPGQLQRYRARARALENHAVWEILEILEKLPSQRRAADKAEFTQS